VASFVFGNQQRVAWNEWVKFAGMVDVIPSLGHQSGLWLVDKAWINKLFYRDVQ
jgi:hypothetical protein